MSCDDEGLMTRRQALRALAAASLCPVLVHCEFVDYDGELVEQSTFSVQDPGLEALQEVGSSACYELGSRGIVLIRTAEDEILGFDQICPHEALNLGQCSGSTSNAVWNQDEKILTCPWHNSRFAADGSVIDGPSPEPIPTYRVEFDPATGEGTVFSSGGPQ